jgi:hypothetical protein
VQAWLGPKAGARAQLEGAQAGALGIKNIEFVHSGDITESMSISAAVSHSHLPMIGHANPHQSLTLLWPTYIHALSLLMADSLPELVKNSILLM